VRVDDDTTQWGTKIDSWLEMGLEEIDDLAIYVIAQFIRRVSDGAAMKISHNKMNEYAGVLKDLRDVRRKIMDLMENNG
jgi:hypothetical protein